MKAMILAAGLGARLRPLTDQIPKPLVSLGGKPVIVHAIERLADAGIRQIAINISHLADAILKELGDGDRWGVQLEYFREPQPTGTGGGLLAARSFLKPESEFIVVNADTYQEIDWSAFLRFHREGGFAVSLSLRSDPDWERYGGIWCEPNGRIASILNTPQTKSASPHLFAGGWIWSRFEWDRLEKASPPSCLIRHMAMPMLTEGRPLGGFLYEGPWHDLGTLERLEKARAELGA